MTFLSSIKSFFSKPIPEVVVEEPTPVVEEIKITVPPRGWREGMWVMDGSKLGILAKIGVPCEVHYTHPETGETYEVIARPLNAFRQAKWPEIPEVRRGITQEQAEGLGYGS